MISYVLSDCHLSGGARVVFEHVRGLTERGHAAQVLYKTGSPAWFTPAVPAKQIDPSQLANVRGIKVATWCETAPWVAESLRDGDRGFYLVQDLDEETYLGRHPQTYSLGLTHIVEGRWVERQLRERFSVDPIYVGIGTHYTPVRINREKKRIFAQCRIDPGDRKGWEMALATCRAAFARDRSTSVVTFGMRNGKTIQPDLPQFHVRLPSDAKLRELYSQAGVFLFTSAHEGFGLPALEAMACGCPVICTLAQGNDEFCVDGETAIVRSNPEGLAAACVEVTRDQNLWDRLSVNGLAMAENYRWPNVIDKLQDIFERKN